MSDNDGHVEQTALSRSINNNENMQMQVLVEAVVVAVYFPEDKQNKTKNEIEYDLDVTSVYGMGRLYRAIRMDRHAGLDDGDDSVLRVASSAADSKVSFNADSSKGKPATARLQTDGDRVVVGFINGNAHRPVILGVLPHFSAKTRRPLKDLAGKDLPRKGLFRRTKHKGTEIVFDEKGNITLTVGKTPDISGKDTDDKKTIKLIIGDFEVTLDNTVSPSVTTFKVKGGGQILKFTKDTFEVGPTGESMALGDTLATLLTGFIAKFNSHQHVGNLGVPTPLVPAFTFTDSVEPIKSTWAKVSKNKP